MNTATTHLARAAAVVLIAAVSIGMASGQDRLSAQAAEDGAVDAARQCDVYIAGAARSTRPDPLRYRWLASGVEVSPWQPVRADGTAPLELCGLPAGRHALTLEVTDGTRVASDTMTATIHDARPLVARGGGLAAR